MPRGYINGDCEFMKLFYRGKDGGKESSVWGYWLVEIKSLFSIALLRFEGDSREAYHTHAFNSVSWVLSGALVEDNLHGSIELYEPSIIPVITKRDTFHKVSSQGTTWVLTFRGPWAKTWEEWVPKENRYITLTNGRKEVV